MFERFLHRVLNAPVTVAIVVGMIVLAGLLAAWRLPVDLFPPLDFPILNIVTERPNFSSLQMEEQLTRPIENAVSGIPGVQKVWSSSGTGISMVSVQFRWGAEMAPMRQLLQQALSDAQAQMPPGSPPTLENLSASLALIEGYSLKGGADLDALRSLAYDQLRPRLQRLSGVYKVMVMGGQIPQIEVWPSEARLLQYRVSLQDLAQALKGNNVLRSPGLLERPSQEFVLHANGQFQSLSDIAETVVDVRGGVAVRVRDLATVGMGHEYERGDASQQGEPAVLITLSKQPDSDTLAVAALVRDEIRDFQAQLPPGVTLSNYYDQASLVGDSVSSVKESVWIGAFLVILVLAFFLRSPAATLVAALSIPISVVSALLLMSLFKIQLNVMSLGGLAIGTGIIVDDTVVVMENIFRWMAMRPDASPRSPLELAAAQKARLPEVLLATQEVAVPVLVSTLANIGIFLPMILVEGFAGRLFAPVSFTVAFALLASLAVALTVIPLLSLSWLGKAPRPGPEAAIHRAYGAVLELALARPWRSVGFALGTVLLALLAMRGLDIGFLPDLDEGAVMLSTLTPPGTSLSETRKVNQSLEAWLTAMPGVLNVVRRTGHAPGAEDTDNANHSDITVKLAPRGDRAMALQPWIARLAAHTAALPNLNVNFLMPLSDKINDALGGVPADLGVNLYGADLVALHGYADSLLTAMAGMKGLENIQGPNDLPVPSLEVGVLRRQAGALGISAEQIFDSLEAYTTGLGVTEIKGELKSTRVTLRFPSQGGRPSVAQLQRLPIRTASGNSVPLGQVAGLSYSELPSLISHEHLSRRVTISTDIGGRKSQGVAAELRKAIAALKLPAGYSWDFSGKYKTEQAALSNMALVLLLSIAVVALILWFEFKSLPQVLLVLLTIPLASMGAVFSLRLLHQSLNVSSMIGGVMLVGIVVRNGIMLLDSMNRSLKQGMPLDYAIRDACHKRVRPILMTATVTMLGLLPLALGWGTGSELQKPLAIAVVGGMLSSTLLTLLALPAACKLVLAPKRAPAGAESME